MLESLQNSHQQEKEQLLSQHAEEKLAMTNEVEQIRVKMEEDSLASKVNVAELQNQVDALKDQIELLESTKQKIET